MQAIASASRLLWCACVMALGIFQFVTICWGLDSLGLHWLLVGFGAAATAFVPLVGTVLAAYGLVTTLHWSWPAALIIPVLGLFMIAPLLWLTQWAEERAYLSASRAAADPSRRP